MMTKVSVGKGRDSNGDRPNSDRLTFRECLEVIQKLTITTTILRSTLSSHMMKKKLKISKRFSNPIRDPTSPSMGTTGWKTLLTSTCLSGSRTLQAVTDYSTAKLHSPRQSWTHYYSLWISNVALPRDPLISPSMI